MFKFESILKFLRKLRSEIKIPELSDGVMPIRQVVEGSDGTRWYKFVISDGFGRKGVGGKRGGKGHYGLDFMRRRIKSGSFYYPEYARHYYCPSNIVEAVACVAGDVIKVFTDGNGTAVYVSHGRYMSVYRHLKNVIVNKGQAVIKGQQLGIVSHAPKNKTRGINHLHFELWDTNRRGTGSKYNRNRQAINPKPFIKKWAQR